MKRLNGIIGMGDPADEYFHKDEEKYGLGQARSKEKFFSLYGIHTDTKTVEQNLCTFVGKPMMQKFKPFLRKNGMGIDFDKTDFEFKDPGKDKVVGPEYEKKRGSYHMERIVDPKAKTDDDDDDLVNAMDDDDEMKLLLESKSKKN